MQPIFEPFTGPVLSNWRRFAVWKRIFLDAAATCGLRAYYTVQDYADPTIDECITKSRRAEILAAAEIAVAAVSQDLSWAAFGEAALARTRAVLAHAADVMEAEATAHQARTVAAAMHFLHSALSPHLRDDIGKGEPYALWATAHAKGYMLMDDCPFFGRLEGVRFDGDHAPLDGLATLEKRLQRFVDVIFVSSHGFDARLEGAADRLKMALLCNACPPAMADVFETWRADEPVWNYASMRRRLVEHWKSLRLDPEADISSALEAPVVDTPEAMAADTLPMAMTSVTNTQPAVAPAADVTPPSSTTIDAFVDGNANDAMGAFHRSQLNDKSIRG